MFAAQRALRMAAASARTRVARPPQAVVSRGMAGGHAKTPKNYTGLEAKVRAVLKEDWQLVLGIMGFYTSLYMVSKLFSGGKKAAPEVVAAVAGAGEATSEVVSIADDKFSEWIKGAGNEKKWEESLNDPKSYA